MKGGRRGSDERQRQLSGRNSQSGSGRSAWVVDDDSFPDIVGRADSLE